MHENHFSGATMLNEGNNKKHLRRRMGTEGEKWNSLTKKASRRKPISKKECRIQNESNNNPQNGCTFNKRRREGNIKE